MSYAHAQVSDALRGVQLEAAQSLVQGTLTALADLPALTDGPLVTKVCAPVRSALGESPCR